MFLHLSSLPPNLLPSPSPRFLPPTCSISLPSDRRLLFSPFPSMPIPLLPLTHACGHTPCSHVNDDDDDDDDDDADTLPYSIALPDRWNVVGVRQAMVDFSGVVDESRGKRKSLDKVQPMKDICRSLPLQIFLQHTVDVSGTRDHGCLNRVFGRSPLLFLITSSYKAAAGGSLSNSLVALARLGASLIGGGPPLSIAMAGSVGDDPLGGFYRSKLRRANVNFLSAQ